MVVFHKLLGGFQAHQADLLRLLLRASWGSILEINPEEVINPAVMKKSSWTGCGGAVSGLLSQVLLPSSVTCRTKLSWAVSSA